ncbi:MAG: archaeosortase/exosortase family protein [Methylococcales bacterium]
MNQVIDTKQLVWKEKPALLIGLGVVAVLLGIIYLDGLLQMERFWAGREEYGHGYIIPFITVFMIWQNEGYIREN